MTTRSHSPPTASSHFLPRKKKKTERHPQQHIAECKQTNKQNMGTYIVLGRKFLSAGTTGSQWTLSSLGRNRIRQLYLVNPEGERSGTGINLRNPTDVTDQTYLLLTFRSSSFSSKTQTSSLLLCFSPLFPKHQDRQHNQIKHCQTVTNMTYLPTKRKPKKMICSVFFLKKENKTKQNIFFLKQKDRSRLKKHHSPHSVSPTCSKKEDPPSMRVIRPRTMALPAIGSLTYSLTLATAVLV